MKQTGLGDNCYVGAFDLSGDVGSLSNISGGPGLTEVTGIDKSAYERLGVVRDGAIEFIAFFNDAAGQEHLALRGLPVADVIGSYFRGTVLGNPTASMVAKQLNYDPTRNEDASLTFKVNLEANGFGLEWGQMLTAGKRTDGGATNGTGVDFAASSAFGLQAYLHVFAFTGTSATITIQESSDNGGGDPYANVVGGAFTTVTASTSERIATASGLTVERFLRVVTTGTFSNLVFAVAVVRNLTAVAF